MSKEYIERDSAITALKDLAFQEDVENSGAYEAIQEVPTADVAPIVHGEWVGIIYCEDIVYATCNSCYSRGKVRTNRNEWGTWYIDSPYCPKCGAKMDGGK